MFIQSEGFCVALEGPVSSQQHCYENAFPPRKGWDSRMNLDKHLSVRDFRDWMVLDNLCLFSLTDK